MANGKHSRLGTVTNMLHKARKKLMNAESKGYDKGKNDILNYFQSLNFWNRLKIAFNPKLILKS